MTALDLRAELGRLTAERLDAVEAGFDAYDAYLADLDEEIAPVRAAYVGLVVTEIATFRGELYGRNEG